MRYGPDIITCSEPGCREEGRFEHRSQRDLRRRPRSPWKCTKHAAGPAWMTTTNPLRTATLVSKKLPGCGDCLFWCPEGSEHGNGYAHGPGFHAMASEFPEGTVLEVTVRAVLPGEATT